MRSGTRLSQPRGALCSAWPAAEPERAILHDLPRNFHDLPGKAQTSVLAAAPPLTHIRWDAPIAAMVEHVARLLRSCVPVPLCRLKPLTGSMVNRSRRRFTARRQRFSPAIPCLRHHGMRGRDRPATRDAHPARGQAVRFPGAPGPDFGDRRPGPTGPLVANGAEGAADPLTRRPVERTLDGARTVRILERAVDQR